MKEEFKKGELVLIPIEKLHPHPDNPRKDLGDLSELAESIKVKGVLQNLTVVPCTGYYYGDYTVIIGHRRTEAAKLAGLTELPCVIAEMTEHEQIATMLLENMQRSDLTVYEQAKGFQMMLSFGDSVEDISEKTGFSESTVRRRVKLLELDEGNFKEAQARGGTLSDYIELDKIKDPKTKDKVLQTIGTDNFKFKLKQAIEDEENEEYLDTVEEAVSEFAEEIKEAPYGERYRQKDGYSVWNKRDVEEPEDAYTNTYYYTRSSRGVFVYYRIEKDNPSAADGGSSPYTGEPNAEATKKEEARQKEEERLGELAVVSERAYKLREEFAGALSAKDIKEHFTDIIAFWMWQQSLNSTYVNEDDVLDIAGIAEERMDDDDNFTYTYEDIKSGIDGGAEKALWNMILLYIDDSENNNYYQRYSTSLYAKNEELDNWYKLLVKMGYEMSDDERALSDGTSELFVI